MDIQRRIQAILPGTVLAGLLLAAAPVALRSASGPKFYPDDPLDKPPPPRNTAGIKPRKTEALFDFIYNSIESRPKTILPAQNVNTMGEVPDGEWYTNRHFRRRMSLDELKRGAGDATPPQAPYSIVGAKLDGISPGFRMKDAKGTLYFIKPDPLSAPEIATAADAVGSRFFHALGYHTPKNYIVYLDRKEVTIAKEGTTDGANGKPRPMTIRDVEKVLWKIPRTSDGKYRLVASEAIEGEPLGPFRYEGTRSDDPNDVVPHENRRELRGLHVFCAWLNHTDAKAVNSQDSLVEQNGVKYVRHYLIDFGAILGSDSDMIKNASFGHEYIIPKDKQPLKRMVSFGFNPEPWETAKTPKIRGVGRFHAVGFDPEMWVSNFPNRAFVHRLPDDEYWAARQVMNFTDQEIRAIVETGHYTDARAIDYITQTLIQRRNKIGQTYLTKVLALDHFRVAQGRLQFADLAAQYAIVAPREFDISWHAFNNSTRELAAIAGAGGASLPAALISAPPGQYFAARIQARGHARKSVTVYLRSAAPTPQIVGIDRTW